MKALRRLALRDHPWLAKPALGELLAVLNADGLNARMVGGCVRDSLLGREIGDIDLACSLKPEETMRRLEAAGIKVIATGLKHGTLTAVLKGEVFEITALRRDVATDGRHATVAFTDDWRADAMRRDFTLNALYLDPDGSLYDPCGGYEDLMAGRVRFIGAADQRIQEDGLRILRFFRFAAQIGGGNLDPQGLAACIRNRDLISRLSGERLAAEIFRILQAENLPPVMIVMAESGILDKILPGHQDVGKLLSYVRLEQSLGRCDALARLACLLGENKEAVFAASRHLRLSNQQRATLAAYATAAHLPLRRDMPRKDVRGQIYAFGRPVFVHALLRMWSDRGGATQDEIFRKLLDYAEQWPVPAFPLRGRDLTAAGLAAGPAMGRSLKTLESRWIDSDFSLTKAELLEKITELHG